MAVEKVIATADVGGVKVNDVKVLGERVAFVANDHAAITDSTTGTSTGSTVDDTTSAQKDDIAVLARKINAILAVLKAHGLLASE